MGAELLVWESIFPLTLQGSFNYSIHFIMGIKLDAANVWHFWGISLVILLMEEILHKTLGK